MPRPTGPAPRRRRRPLPALAAAAFALCALALAGLVRAYALPVEARTHDTWYAYTQELQFGFTARVRTGSVYTAEVVRPEQLVQTRLPVEPPQFRRVLVGKLTDQVELSLPYTFRGDRPAALKATYRLEGKLVAPLWQRPYALRPPETVSVTGTEVTLGREPVVIPVTDLIAEMERITREIGVNQELVELQVRPVVEVEASGLRDPVRTGLAPEFRLILRGGLALDVDEPRAVRDEKTLQTTSVVPVTLRLLGQEVRVATLRRVTLTAAAILAAAAGLYGGARWLRRRRRAGSDLDRLRPAVIGASAFELGPGIALIDVGSARELLQLHLQSERPVIQVGHVYYLVDGSTCYRLDLTPAGEAS